MRCQASVSPADVRAIGAALARVHRAAEGVQLGDGRFRFEDLKRRLRRIAEATDPEIVAVGREVEAALDRFHGLRDASLPRGFAHTDLFRDNVLWAADGGISALLDFESACRETYAYDLVVTVLAWCVGDDLEPSLVRAMIDGYESERPLSRAEREGLWAEACFAALRFTITRITDYALRTAGGPRVVKDWRRFWMRFRRLEQLGPTGLEAIAGAGAASSGTSLGRA